MRLLTSGCNTVVEKPSILVGKTLYLLADGLNSKIKDTNDVLEIIDNCLLVSFDVVNMFPNIDNNSGLLSVKEALTDSNFYVDSTQCIVDASEKCLTRNNSKFNHQHFLQTAQGTAQSLMVQHRVLICLVLMLTLSWLSMTLLPIISMLSLVFGKDLEMIFLYYGNMLPLLSFPF